ncbi:MDR family MFS transporter [Saccharomonospora sp. NPDC006951]
MGTTSTTSDSAGRVWPLACVLMPGAAMTMVDATAVNVALRTIQKGLQSSLSTVQWVVSGYVLAMAVVVPFTGWAVDRFGAKRMWCVSLSIFVLGSGLAGLTTTVEALIAFRILQGLGGGMLVPIAQAILAAAAGPRRLGSAMSTLGTVAVLGPVLGPVLGGALVDHAGWQWIFYVNLPIGVVALLFAARVLPRTRGPRPHPLDVIGLGLASGGMFGLVFGLSQAASGASGFGESGVYGPIVAGGVSLTLFALHSLRKGEASLLDLRLLRNRDLTAASVCQFLIFVALFGAQLLLPLFFQVARDMSVLEAGLLLAPQGIGVAIAMPIAGRLTDRFGPRLVVLPGLLLAGVGTLAYTGLVETDSMTMLTCALLVRGMGIGFLMAPTTAAAYSTLPTAVIGRATSITAVLRQLGSAVGTALFAVMFARDVSRLPIDVAFANAFWLAVGLTVLIGLPALFLGQARRKRYDAATASSGADMESVS